MSGTYTIRTMTRTELDLAIEWAAQEGWNPGLQDAASFYAADPTGFLVGLLDGVAIASISAVKYAPNFAFIGFYIVKPEYRGQGYGWQIWQAAIASVASRNVGLDGVVAQQENYKKSGFNLAYNNVRYSGLGGGQVPESPGLKPLAVVNFESIDEYDRRFFPGDRRTFLKSWLQQPDSTTWVMVNKTEITGYGMVRPCRRGYKIGPLFADNAEIAAVLFLALKSSLPAGSELFLDVPMVNPEAIALAQRYQLQPVFETARMYTQAPPTIPVQNIFGVTSFELG
ncbi:GNAT family N-acetyltransferase [Picosynechococcus sp. PCC 11901]|uniref:GNAT family N-acetyltransferase n=1 Tax=Picosynechococcus sp. PCC 11901 TaxID=2579791 RepID=UPI0010FC3ADF|nr:GNAT family N-acetyltransferase [Picosynechococcus sp. PCC 11901]QCS48259.1 GNAT family N-acetyltransferase [Picosynechococcus sp. PCC 11901]